ncbi:hypothetical protein [Halomicrobium urmianum]|uniref:hypothetical protein n=1 Tax=Halomicrobium urmianum TaxID=1586233 RepID=UPI001CD94489|nr:hypothetical protein [Halomicrobium urmianum]
MTGQFRIHIRKVDHDEFTAYKWGTIDPDGTISISDEGDRFGDLEEYVRQTLPETYHSEPLSPEIVQFWLERGRSYGSQAHRIKATVEHPLVDRHLAFPELDLVSVLHGLDQPASSCEAVHQLIQDSPFVTRSDASEDDRVASVVFNLPKQVDIETAVTATMKQVFDQLSPQEILDRGYVRRLPSRYLFRVVQYARPVAEIGVSRESLSSADSQADVNPSELANKWEIVTP